jgi:GNAT superfamily N-acetyltransferase
MFVDPGWSGNGIGGQLMRYIEGLAAEEGYDYMETEASITAHGFYLSLGYTDLGQNDGDLGLTYSMRKPLPTAYEAGAR